MENIVGYVNSNDNLTVLPIYEDGGYLTYEDDSAQISYQLDRKFTFKKFSHSEGAAILLLERAQEVNMGKKTIVGIASTAQGYIALGVREAFECYLLDGNYVVSETIPAIVHEEELSVFEELGEVQE